MKLIGRIVIFLLLNFGALAIGGFFTGPGVSSDWYQNLNQAPWTPPGWVFGAAWTTIMICFSVYMAYAVEKITDRIVLLTLYGFQWVLNVSWNPVFFYLHYVLAGLVIITMLTFLMGYFLRTQSKPMGAKSLLVLPYFIWLLIATSLNAYILLNN